VWRDRLAPEIERSKQATTTASITA
jgi:hypothetical protein